MTSYIRFLDPTEPLCDHEIRVILRTRDHVEHVEHGLAVGENRLVSDIFMFASHIFHVGFMRIRLALDMMDVDEETKKKYEASGGYQILTGFERIDTLVKPLERAGHILEIHIKDGDASVCSTNIPLSH